MTLTILIDLDDTLLINNAESFQKAYLKALAAHLQPRIPPEALIQHLLEATKAMYRKVTPVGTLRETFDSHFYPALGVNREEIADEIDHFYTQVFPTLREHTRPRPEAAVLVEKALQRGHQIVVATNPLFPRVAILERLRWAEVPPEHIPFALIPDYETFHFCKPHPAFFAEILATLRWPERGVVMIGNSPEEDILPAETLGIPTFWVNESPQPLKIQRHPLSTQGPLSEALQWLDEVEVQVTSPEFRTPNAILAGLAATPPAIENLTRNLPRERWSVRPEPKEWAVNEIVCHLRDVDRDVNLPRIKTLLASENPFLPGIETDTWAEERQYLKQDGQMALKEFFVLRDELLTILGNLETDQWEHPARHAIFGPTTLREIVSFIMTHDRLHIRQIGETLDRVNS